MEERDLQKLLSGDGEAFRLFVETYRTYLYQVVHSVLHHPKDSEDVTQEVFVQIYLSLPQYRNQGFKTWITRIAVNKAIDWKRKRERRRENLEEEVDPLHSAVLRENDAERPLMEKERQEQFQRQLDELPETQRKAVVGYYFEEKTYKEIAEEEGIAVKSVESALYRAKHWLRKHWKEGKG